MTKTEFLRALEEQLEAPEGSLRGDEVLSELENWDSMAALLFIALADEKLGVRVSGNQIANAKSMGDLLSLLDARLAA